MKIGQIALREPQRWPFFYGWFIIVLGTFGVLMSIPGQTIGVSTFTDSLLGVLELDRDQLSLAYMCGTIASSLMLTWAGKLYDRLGVKPLALVAVFGLGITLFLLSVSDLIASGLGGGFWMSFLVLALGFVMLRFFGQGVLTMASQNMMVKWFDKRRGFAMSFSSVALALCFSIAPLFLDGLIQTWGWRGAWRLMGLVMMTLVPLVIIFFFIDNPQSVGLKPDGNYIPKENAKRESLNKIYKEFTLSEARRSFTYWIFVLFLAMQGLFGTGFTFHVVSIFAESDLTRQMALSVFPPAAAIAMMITFVFSWASDYMPLKYILLLKGMGAMLATFGLFYLSSHNVAYYMMIVGYGMSGGLYRVIYAVSWPKLFGQLHLGAISGQAMTVIVFGSALGPVLFSYSLSQFGTYGIAALCCTLIYGLLTIAAIFANNPQLKWQESKTAS